MRMLSRVAAIGSGWAALCPPAFAVTQEEALANITMLMLYVAIAFALIVVAGVYFNKSQDRRDVALDKILPENETVHSVAPYTLVSECVRLMSRRRIGALVIIEGDSVKGIFTERDALNRVLAVGLDPAHVSVSQVMTRDPTVVLPSTTVAEAMELITTRRFRHLPIVEDGKLLAIVSSGDLTRWLVQDQEIAVQKLVSLVVPT